MSTQETILKIISEQLGVVTSEIQLTSDIVEDLGADSLDGIELIMTIEEEFDIQIPDDDGEKLRTPEDILKYLKDNHELE